jgi:hypothetical protein
MSCFPGMLLRYCLSDLEVVSVGLIVSDTIFLYTTYAVFLFGYLCILKPLRLI